MKAAIIGAGPAGSYVASLLAPHGIDTSVFHKPTSSEKPCGGGVTSRAMNEFSIIQKIEDKANRVEKIAIISPSGRIAEIELSKPIYIFSRSEFDSFLREHAEERGAHIIREKVIDFIRNKKGWEIRTDKDHVLNFDFIVGADGAAGQTRKKLSVPFSRNELTQTCGYLIEDSTGDRITLKFQERLEGYLWSFPRKNMISVGIGVPLGADGPRESLKRVEDFIGAELPELKNRKKRFFSALIPCVQGEANDLKAAAGLDWALVGDSCGITDPITREGIYHALKTASLLGDALKKEDVNLYPSLIADTFSEETSWAMKNRSRLFRSAFIDAAVDACNESRDIRAIIAQLFAGTLRYNDLMPKLFGIALRADMSLLGRLISTLG